MYSIKGSWVGQTFALATSGDPGGKKTRIRRSKEERKTLVESFIKKYQSSNGGNFPSLNLTHKEVGGSFYTVREIVREIIQENRVLGPAPFDSEHQKVAENLVQQYPLGSISTVPLNPFFESAEGIVTNCDNQGVADVEPALNVGGCYANQQISDDLLYIDGSEVHGTSAVRTDMEELKEESDELNGIMVDGKSATKTWSYEMSEQANELNDSVGDETCSGRTQIDKMSEESDELNGTVAGRSSSHIQMDDISKESSALNGSGIVETSVSGDQINDISIKYDELNGAVEGETSASETQIDVISKESDDLNEIVADTANVSRIGVDEISKDTDELPNKEPLASEISDAARDDEVTVTGTSKLGNPTEDVTFPVQPVTKELYLDGASDGSGNLGGSSLGLRTEKVDLGNDGSVSVSEQMGSHGNLSNPMNGEATNDHNDDVCGTKPGSSNEQLVLNTYNKSTEIVNSDTREGNAVAPRVITGEDARISPNDVSPKRIEQHNIKAVAKPESAVDGSISRNPNGASSTSTLGVLTTRNETVTKDAEKSAQQVNNQTLNRINLESWERSSKRTRKQEINPLAAFVEALVSAFVKFWCQ